MGVDLISEWIMPSKEVFEEVLRIMSEDPGIREHFLEDEDRFIDRRRIVMLPCEVVDSGVRFNPRGTVFDTPTGEPSWQGMTYGS